MADFGQYSQKTVFGIIQARKGSGVCDRCGSRTRVKTVFGMTICNACWIKQFPKKG